MCAASAALASGDALSAQAPAAPELRLPASRTLPEVDRCATGDDRVRQLGLLKDYPNVDGVIAIVHRQGCGMQFDGPDHQQLDRTLAGFARDGGLVTYE